ncbi:MAG: porin, partial [Alphaproteobacteria bacterium]|nr:porin [Alphaproteobacteria bacterium]
MRRRVTAALLAGAAVIATSHTAFAAAQTTPSTDDRLRALEEELASVNAQLGDLKRSQSNQYDDVNRQFSNLVVVKMDNGRPTFASPDGNFTLAIRALAQLDSAYYSQSAHAATLPAAFGPDLSSGTNFRRVYLGIQGKVFGNFSYNLNFDFGGSGGTELPGRVQS